MEKSNIMKEYVAKKAATDILEWALNPKMDMDSDYATHRIMAAIDEYIKNNLSV